MFSEIWDILLWANKQITMSCVDQDREIVNYICYVNSYLEHGKIA